MVALVAAAAVVALFQVAWVPVINRTLAALPPTGAIRGGQLHWPHARPVRIVGSSFLWITIDPHDSLETGEGPDLRVELGQKELRVRGLFGCLPVPYPNGFIIDVNRTTLEPWWGAWHPAVAAGLGVGVVAGLFVIWGFLALLYAWPVRLIAFYADREASWAAAWRLASAALLPGALFFVLAILAYTFHQLNLMQFLTAAMIHVLIGWVYVLFAPFCLPRNRSAGKRTRGNPFQRASKSE